MTVAVYDTRASLKTGSKIPNPLLQRHMLKAVVLVNQPVAVVCLDVMKDV